VLISDFHDAIESRGDGLHPMLKAFLVRQVMEMPQRADGMLQAGPGTASEASLQERRCDLILSSHPGRALTTTPDAPGNDASGAIAILQRKA
jgi:hypothetical protein